MSNSHRKDQDESQIIHPNDLQKNYEQDGLNVKANHGQIELGSSAPIPIANAAANNVVSSSPKPSPKKDVIKCAHCNKRAGLTAIQCKCNKLFCSMHRYPEVHNCTYDYKAAQREKVAKENPLVAHTKVAFI